MKNSTGVMLSEVRGPLNNLIDNLSGEYSAYWLKALKRLLRKEEIPEPPEDAVQLDENFEKELHQRISKWIELFRSQLAVLKAEKEKDIASTVIDLDVHTNAKSIYAVWKHHQNFTVSTGGFIYGLDCYVSGPEDKHFDNISDEIYTRWMDQFKYDGSNRLMTAEYDYAKPWEHEGKAVTLPMFYEAVSELSEMYKNAIPTP